MCSGSGAGELGYLWDDGDAKRAERGPPVTDADEACSGEDAGIDDDAFAGDGPCERGGDGDDAPDARNLGIQPPRWRRREGRTLPGATAEAMDVDAKLVDALVDAAILAV